MRSKWSKPASVTQETLAIWYRFNVYPLHILEKLENKNYPGLIN